MSELKNQELPQLAQAFIVEPIHKGGRVVWEADYIILRNAALNELKGLRAELNILRESEVHRKELITELAAKDARIAELEQRCNTFMQGLEAEEEDCEALHAKLEAAEKSLCAVSEVLKKPSLKMLMSLG